jgi:hypothetical protein
MHGVSLVPEKAKKAKELGRGVQALGASRESLVGRVVHVGSGLMKKMFGVRSFISHPY